MRRIGEIIDELDLSGKNDELIKELVALSTKHGILTPYTSYLADENAPARQLASDSFGLGETRLALEQLSELDGVAGVAQRGDKNALKSAALPATAASPAFGGGGFGSAPGSGPAGDAAGIARGARASNAVRDLKTDRETLAAGVQNVGRDTLYKRGNLWIAENARTLDPEKDAAKIQRIKRFSDEYFTLVRENTTEENAVLATQQEGEELLVMLRGKAYRIE
jgi:Ca-activated chloride channel family protein